MTPGSRGRKPAKSSLGYVANLYLEKTKKNLKARRQLINKGGKDTTICYTTIRNKKEKVTRKNYLKLPFGLTLKGEKYGANCRTLRMVCGDSIKISLRLRM